MAAIFALAVSVVIAALVGALIVRLDGLPFAMLTLAISVMLLQVVQLNSLRPYLGGSSGLVVSPDGTFFGMTTDQLADPKQFWPIVWVVACLCVTAVWWLGRSRFGRTLRGIRENEQRMRYSGFNTYWPRIAAFTISSAIAGLAGILHILFQGFATTDMLGFQFSGNAIVSALVGGVGSAFGPVLGGLFYIWGQSKLSTSGNLELYTGIAVAIVIVFFPRGVTGLIGENVRKLRARRANRKEGIDA
jgi:branched-chain amino acid transport system permease protein